jgi:cobalt/nickel transport system ATP-binding protein
MGKKIIEIHNLHHSYPDGTKALRDITIDISDNESVGIVGPTAAGKSTLLLHLNGYFSGDHHVLTNGMTVTKENLSKIRRDVGIVFQDADTQLFMLTVFDDIAFGPLNMGLGDDEVRNRVQKTLAQVNLKGYEQRAPYHLSGGEKRAVAIATVLAMEPNILVMDEPTSNLDPRTRRQLINLLKTFTMTKIIASHDLEMILDLCPRAIVLDEGYVVADGPTIDLFSNEELMEKHGLEKPLSLKGR